jgi:uncharacterized membrane protein (UPF0182 family)
MLSLFRSRLSFWLLTTTLIVGFLFLLNLPDLLVEWLWMENLGHASVFWTIRLTQAGLFAAAFLIVCSYLGINAYALSSYLSTHQSTFTAEGVESLEFGEVQLPMGRVNGFLAAGTALGSLFFSAVFLVRWDTFLRFANGQTFGETDPIFGIDAGFYVFSLPFYELLQNNLASLAFLTLAVLALVYAYTGGFTYYREFNRLRIHPYALRHLSANIIVLLLAWAIGYYLNRYNLLLAPDGLTFGAGYTDMVIKHPALWVMIAASVAFIVLVLVNLRTNRPSLLAAGAGVYFLIHAVGLLILPAAVQSFHVEPNELETERPYIEHNISSTRQAYGLDAVEEKSYNPSGRLAREDLATSEQTLQNVRLWDPRLLIQTYRQLQEIRTYYQFYNVDVDRYTIDGDYRQVMLSARELTGELPEQASSWVNRHLQFTHGYGLTMNYVSQEGSEGIPELLIKDLPPTAAEGLEVDEAAIYYGEEMPHYKIVNTGVQELDYPSGDENVYTSYRGSGGVQLDAYWKKLLYAFDQGDVNILLSDYPTEESRIQYWMRVRERLQQVAPFLRVDDDPYLVLNDGQLYWIIDAYTTSNNFPYAEPDRERNLNYIRNSVKVVVDAYEGSVELYTVNEDDPVLQMYQQAFPDLFKSLDELSDGLESHLRYPEELFNIQIDKYNTYHMTNPQVFYNNEDLWTRPREFYGGSQRIMTPYYLLMRLPGEDEAQFLLMSPLTPEYRDNMIAWIAAKSDGPDYGELVVYKLPKERMIYGPNQIEAKIDQNTEISQQLSLWDQRGSRVIRGNLLAIPIEKSFLYVEPVFLIAQGTEIPQLRRVIVSYGDRIAMETTFTEALDRLLDRVDQQPVALPTGDTADTTDITATDTTVTVTPSAPPTPEFANTAREKLEAAENALRDGEWSGFGTQLQELRQLLENPDEWQQED